MRWVSVLLGSLAGCGGATSAQPLNQKNVADENPEIVERLAEQLDGWHKWALENQLATDDAAAESMSSEELEQLRSLGYVQ